MFCKVPWVPIILTSANILGYFKESEAVWRNLLRAAGQPELEIN
jgi:hypothetical protein